MRIIKVRNPIIVVGFKGLGLHTHPYLGNEYVHCIRLTSVCDVVYFCKRTVQ